MPTTSPHPTIAAAIGFLNLQPTLCLELTDTGRNQRTHLPPLRYLVPADRLGELYELAFPDHPEWLEQEEVNWVDEEDVAAAVERFLQRVNMLFPVYAEVWDADLDAIEWRLHEIPVTPMGYDLWHDEWEDFQEPAAYLLHLQHSRDGEHYPHRHDLFADLYPEHQVPAGLEPQELADALRRNCSEQDPPAQPELAALPDLIQMLNQSTNNVWLDVGELSLADGGGYPEWSCENIDWLAAEWREARPVFDAVLSLLKWKDESAAATSEKLTAVRNALISAYEERQHHEPTDVAPTPPP